MLALTNASVCRIFYKLGYSIVGSRCEPRMPVFAESLISLVTA